MTNSSDDPFDMDHDEDANLVTTPTKEEAEKLLEESPISKPQFSPLTDTEASPTEAVKAAIEAKI